MVLKIEQPDDIIRIAQERYMKGTDFRRVSDSREMREFYDKQTELSGVKGLVESGGEVRIGDIAGGSGRQGDSVRRILGDKADSVKIDVFDISVEAMKGLRGQNRIVSETMHLKAADGTYDILFMNNVPVPLSSLEGYVRRMKELEDKRDHMLEMLNLAVDSVVKLNLLEAVRVLKDDGVIVLGVDYGEPRGKPLSRESLEKIVKDLPLKVEEFQIRKYDEKLVPMWRNYGSDIGKPKFVHAVLRKTGSDISELVALDEQMLEFSLRQFMRIEGFDKALEEMAKAKKGE